MGRTMAVDVGNTGQSRTKNACAGRRAKDTAMRETPRMRDATFKISKQPRRRQRARRMLKVGARDNAHKMLS